MQIKIGNQSAGPCFLDTEAEHCRTDEQMQAFVQMVEDPQNEFDFLCTNPFRISEGKKYRNTFWMYYYTKQGQLRTISITPTGRIHFRTGPRAGHVLRMN